MAEATKLEVSVEALQDIHTKISELDTKLATASGNEGQAKRALVEQITTENTDKVDTVLRKIVNELNKLDTPILVGLTSRLSETIKSDFESKVEGFIKEQLSARTTETKGDVEKLRGDRKALVEQDRAIRTLLSSIGVDTSSVEEPKRGGGRPAGSGTGTKKSGKNKQNYQFTMDGEDRPPSQNTFSALAYYATKGVPKALGASENGDDRWGAPQLKTWLGEQGIKYGEDDTWEVELPNKRKIGARRVTETATETPEGEVEAA